MNMSKKQASLLVQVEVILSHCYLIDPLVTHLLTSPRYIYTLQRLHILIFVHASIFFLVAPIDMPTLTYIYMQLDSEKVVLEEHPIGVTASEAP